MQIVPNYEIQMFVTSAEADIIQRALAQYNGPYSPDAELTPQEVDRKYNLIETARELCEIIQKRLEYDYHNSFVDMVR